MLIPIKTTKRFQLENAQTAEGARMSDQELNRALTEAMGIYYADGDGSDCVVIHDGTEVFDYTDFNDLMPLVIEHMFSIHISRNMIEVRDCIYDQNQMSVFYDLFDQEECHLTHKIKVTKRTLAETLLKVVLNVTY